MADMAMLADDAGSMTFTYQIENTGEYSLNEVVLSEHGLVGRTIASGGVDYLIADDGAIPAEVYTAPLDTLAVGGAFTCTFDVPILEEVGTAFSYSTDAGTVTVKATAGTSTVIATDTMGAFRLDKNLGSLLPDTGTSALLWVLLLGLLATGYGTYRYLREKE